MKVNYSLNVTAKILAVLFTIAASGQAQWSRVADVPQQETSDLSIDNGALYVASADAVYRRTSAGQSFTLLGTPAPGTYLQSLFSAGNRLIVGTYDSGVYESTNGGMNWSARNSGLSGAGSEAIVCIAARGDSIYIGTSGSGIFVSSLSGTLSWKPFRDSLFWRVAWDIYTLYTWDGMLFTGAGQNAYVHRNSPGQSYWQGFPFNESVGTGLAMVGFGQMNDTLIGVAFNGIYMSPDSGQTWSYFPAPFTAAFAGSVITFGNRTMAMLSHQLQGTYIWEWTGSTWELFNYQPGLLAYEVVYFDGRLYAAAFDGLWYLPLNPTSVDPGDQELPSSFSLSQNYPNPFNPSTTITYSLPEKAHITLSIFNILGRRIVTLADEEKPAGNHTATWQGTDSDGDAVASGIYFYRLQTGRYTETRKMILLK